MPRSANEDKIKRLRIGITGSPGTGKKSVANALCHLTGLKVISLNRLAIKTKSGRRINREFVVDIQSLRRRQIATEGRIVVGHLLPLVVSRSALDFVAILRCSPTVLRKRYLSRGYSKVKIRENIESELLDIVSFSALKKYGRRHVSEFDTTSSKTPDLVASQILQTIEGKRPKHYGIAKWSEKASKSVKSLMRMMRS